MHNPLVTIVTPSYNQGPFIRATIESVLAQDYPNIEYIVMDGGSTDETASIVNEYASRLTWISEKDRGQSHAINKGFRMAKGSILAWINSDDVLLPGAVGKAVRAFERNPALGAVYGEGYLIDREGNVTSRFPHTQPFDLWRLVYVSDYILQQSTYFRRSALDDVGLLDEDLHYSMDWDLFIRIGKRYPIGYVPEYLGCLREYPEAKSFTGGAPRAKEIARMLRRHTGMRFPPGSIIYGLDTYRRIWCQKIAAKTPGLLNFASSKLQWFVMVGCGLLIDRAIHRSQGWYIDAWAGPVVRAMLPPPRDNEVVIRGELPDCPIREQCVVVTLNGVTAARRKLRAGPFEIRIEVPVEFRYQAVHLVLKASRFFVPAAVDGTPARRRLCYLLREVALREQPAQGSAVPCASFDEPQLEHAEVEDPGVGCDPLSSP
jgi:glycosyltransferase involved in cell wall biosynthesis